MPELDDLPDVPAGQVANARIPVSVNGVPYKAPLPGPPGTGTAGPTRTATATPISILASDANGTVQVRMATPGPSLVALRAATNPAINSGLDAVENPITVQAPAGQSIEGEATFVINMPSMTVRFVPDGLVFRVVIEGDGGGSAPIPWKDGFAAWMADPSTPTTEGGSGNRRPWNNGGQPAYS